MDGIFVDAGGRLVVIPRVSHANDVAWVYGVKDRDDAEYDPDGWKARMEKVGEGRVTLVRADASDDGEFESDHRIRWQSGDTWVRLQMSHEQIYLLTRRPYVPMTVVLMSGAWTALRALYGSLPSVRFFRQRE